LLIVCRGDWANAGVPAMSVARATAATSVSIASVMLLLQLKSRYSHPVSRGRQQRRLIDLAVPCSKLRDSFVIAGDSASPESHRLRRYSVGLSPACLRNAFVNELTSLKPRSNPICVTDTAGLARRLLAFSMRRLVR
jgi:hypothetical protein